MATFNYITARFSKIQALCRPLCRVCHEPCDDQHPDGALCDRHSRRVNTYLALLGRCLVEFQDNFLNPGALPVAGETVKDNWKWRTIASHLQCEKSLVEIAPHLQQLWDFDSQHRGNIAYIAEMKFWAGPRYHYTHCAFTIHLNDHRTFVFDPTGLQFGLNWPLLSPLADYWRLRIGDNNPGFRLGRLGRNKKWKEDGQTRDYHAASLI